MEHEKGSGLPFALPPRLSLESQQRKRADHSPAQHVPKKGEPWTAQEHLQFLEGLRHFGKGNWKQISKVYCPTRTPTQVASHAQKHFIRVSRSKGGKRRSRFTEIEEDSLAATVASTLACVAVGPGGAGDSAAADTPASAPAPGEAGRAHTPPQPPGPPAPLLRPIRPAMRPPSPGPDGVALGIPMSVLTGLPPPPAYAGSSELPILPVKPGRIRAVMEPPAAANSAGSGSEGVVQRRASPGAARAAVAPSAGAQRSSRASGSSAGGSKTGTPPLGLHPPRQQQQQQQQQGGGGPAVGGGAAISSTSQRHSASSGTGLDALAMIAEAEAVSKPAGARSLLSAAGPAPLQLPPLPLTLVRPIGPHSQPPPLPVVLEQQQLPKASTASRPPPWRPQWLPLLPQQQHPSFAVLRAAPGLPSAPRPPPTGAVAHAAAAGQAGTAGACAPAAAPTAAPAPAAASAALAPAAEAAPAVLAAAPATDQGTATHQLSGHSAKRVSEECGPRPQ